MMWWWGPGWGGPGTLLGLFVLVFLIALVTAALVVLIVRLVRGPRHRDWVQGAPPDWTMPRQEDPEQVLRTRFARGEIGAEEFQQRLDVLRRT